MIIFLITKAHLYTHNKLHGLKDMPSIGIWDYESFLAQESVPIATYVFTDIDPLDAYTNEVAAIRYRQIAAASGRNRVYNDPARVMTRFTLLRTLFEAGINSFNVYRVDERVSPARYPVFLRREHGHDPALSDLLHSKSELDQAISRMVELGVPERNLLIVEYCSEPVVPGLFRKLGVLRIGAMMVPTPAAHDSHWFAKGKLGIAGEALYNDEYDLVTSHKYFDELMRVFELAHIDYGRVDFNLVRGRVEIYEINTNPVVGPYGDHPFPIRIKTQDHCWERHVAALKELERVGMSAG